MQDIIPLSSLSIGQKSKIAIFNINSPIKARLLDLGFINGSDICCVLKNPSGDPTAYLIRQTLIALRKEDADNIFVTV